MSDVSRWPEISAALDALLDMDAAARERELRRIALHSPSLAGELRLLFAAERDTGLLELGVMVAAPELMRTLAHPSTAQTSGAAGHAIGRWHLLREVGRGGMGEVWLAERDEGDFVQQAAVKRLKRGMDSIEVLRRFAQERRILAGLNHPYIARLLDGGLDEQGRPFYAMEFVEGEPITEHARRHALGVHDRLQLMRKVCAAVGYAQSRLVVHRDLKPSNILVDARGEPKLLDFGIAKILSDSHDAGLTGTGMRVLSPAYAAPEQILGEPVTTATDVYALGVLLFELLTGRLPHRRSGLVADISADALAQVSSERPSQALRKASLEEAGRAYGVRAGERERIARELTGDLDRIVLAALRREPERRYASAARLADDLRLYLDGRPITARPDTSGYRLRKFVKRHRVGALATVLVACSLLGGLGAALWQAGVAQRNAREARAQAARAEHEARNAQAQAKRAEQTKTFVVSLFEQSNPERSGKGAELTAVELVREAAGRVERELADAPESQAELRVAIGDSLVALGAVDDGVAMVEAGVRQMRAAGRHDELFAQALHALAMKYEIVGRLDEAAQSTAQALNLLDGLQGDHTLARVAARTTLAKLAGLKGDLAGAERLYRQNLDERRARLGRDDARLAVDWNNLAAIALRRDRYAEAERAYAEASRVMALDPDAPASRQAWLQSGRGFALMGLGDFAGARRAMRDAIAIAERTLHARHPIIAAACLGLSAVARYEGDFDQAAEAAARAVAIYAHTDHPDQGLAESQLGLVRLEQGRVAEARAVLAAAVQHLGERRNREDVHYWMARAASAQAALRSGDAAGAAALDEALAALERPAFARGNQYAEVLHLMRGAAQFQGDGAAVRRWGEREAATLERIFGPRHPRSLAARRVLRELR